MMAGMPWELMGRYYKNDWKSGVAREGDGHSYLLITKYTLRTPVGLYTVSGRPPPSRTVLVSKWHARYCSNQRKADI